MTLHALKPRFQALLRPLAGALARAGVTANQITLVTCVASVALGAWLALRTPDTRAFLALPLWMLVRMALNALDGMLAREFGQQSRLGAYLNELADVVADAALIAPFALVPPFASGWIGTVIVLATIAEYAGVLGPLAGASRRYDGPFGKSDRALAFGALGLWVGLAAPLPPWTAWLLPLAAAACAWTIVNRVRGGLGEAVHE